MEEYQAQYKKTYFEDEENLRNLARTRLGQFIRSMGWNKRDLSQKKVLEIGSATGFFLDEARKLGLSVQGLEISKVGVEYSVDKLGLDVVSVDFLDSKSMDWGEFDGIFSFFTIEHMSVIGRVWENIDRILAKNGGIFLALPSFFGPTFQTNPKEWFQTHPKDHFYDYSPQSLKKVLKLIGYKTLFSKPLSYHSYRDKGWRGQLPNIIYKWIADWQCYGDTFQIIAKKM